MAKKKYYVVWNGVNPGVYDSWNECKKQIDGYDGALYKSFSIKVEAEQAFNDNPYLYIGKQAKEKHSPAKISYKNNPNIVQDSLSVDAACSGNPGLLEYRGVYLKTGEEVFRQGPFEQGTNNIGEFLAIVHGLALLKQKQVDIPIYSDSVNAIKWVKDKKCKTKLDKCPENMSLFYLIERAEKWLRENSFKTPILKWQTSEWGEIPADFGRK